MAVLNLESSGIEPSAIIALSDRLRGELLNTGRYSVLERGKMDEILKEVGLQQSGVCSSTECVVEAGRILRVRYMIAGSVGRVGKIYTISATLIDVETGELLNSLSEDCECPIEKVPGVTPLTVEGLDAGQHFIRMATQQFSGSQTIMIQPDQINRVEMVLSRSRGSMKIYTTPYEAEVYVDNQRIGISPVIANNLDAGEHLVRISKKGYMDHEERAEVTGDETGRIDVTLKLYALLSMRRKYSPWAHRCCSSTTKSTTAKTCAP